MLVFVGVINTRSKSDLEKKEFTLVYDCRRMNPSWWRGMATSGRHGVQNRKLRMSHLQPYQEAEREN